MIKLDKHINRSAKGVLECAIHDTRIIAIQGARQTGKSTLAKELASADNDRYLTLDTASVRESAKANPADFVRQSPDGMLVIDEIQRVPELVLELKELVDASSRPGQFLITGSSDLAALTGVQESLAGRMERIELMPFSQQELRETNPSFFPDIFDPEYAPKTAHDVLTRKDYLELAMAGGYPEALLRSDKQRRDVWFDNYIRLLFEQEANSNSQINADPLFQEKFFSYLATIGGKELVVDSISNDMNIKRYGVEQLLARLQRLFLIKVMPAWSTNLTNRAIKQAKVFLKDSGIAARLLRASPSTSSDLTSPIAGAIFETFVVNELLRMANDGRAHYDFYHYRDMRKREVDIVIENEYGKVLLIEVKASSTVAASDFSAINYLLSKHPDRVARGLVIYTGSVPLPFGEKLLALPASCIWA